MKAPSAAARVEFNWDIHHACNYRCPYCFSHNLWKELASRNKYFPAERWLGAWHRIQERYGAARIKIACGEPFIYPEFFRLVQGLSQEHTLEIVTNLSCGKEELGAFLAGVAPGAVTLYASFHPHFEQCEPFIEKALMVKGKGFLSGVNFVVYPAAFDQMKYFKRRFEAAGLNFCLLPFRGAYRGAIYPDAYTEEEKRTINETSDSFSAEQRESLRRMVTPEKTKGRLCRAGQAYACIESDGTVSRCGESKDKCIGDFFDEDFALYDRSRPCENEKCPCEFRWLAQE
jgi:MoaA/NifB/PqqE/SkfB family radical SAM enzyme